MTSNQIMERDCDAIIECLGSRLDPLAGGRIFISGAGGFLCSYIVDVIARWNHGRAEGKCQIIAADNQAVGKEGRLSHHEGDSNVSLVNIDVTKPLELDSSVDWLVHGASIASPIFYRKFPLQTLDANIAGTRNLLDEAVRSSAKGIVVLSSSEIYGDPDAANIPTSESYPGNVSCVGPRACYDESKRVSETLSWVYHSEFDVPVKVIRPFNVFGPGQRLDDERIVPDLMRASLERKPIILYSDGRATRSLCYISDAIAGLLAVLTDSGISGEAYNLGNNEIEISMADLAEVMCDTAEDVLGDYEFRVEFENSADPAYNTNNPQRRCPNLQKIRSAVGYKPEVSLREGLRRTLKSYVEAGK